MRATEHAPRGRFYLLERIDGLAEIVERGTGVQWYHSGTHAASDLQACEPLVEGLPRTFVVDAAGVELKDLMAAIGIGDVEAVRTLVESIDVNARFGCWTALHFATLGGYTGKKRILPRQAELVTVLLRSGAAVDARTVQAAEYEYLDWRGTHGAPGGRTPLMIAAANSQFTSLETAKVLLQSGADVNARDDNRERRSCQCGVQGDV